MFTKSFKRVSLLYFLYGSALTSLNVYNEIIFRRKFKEAPITYDKRSDLMFQNKTTFNIIKDSLTKSFGVNKNKLFKIGVEVKETGNFHELYKWFLFEQFVPYKSLKKLRIYQYAGVDYVSFATIHYNRIELMQKFVTINNNYINYV